MPELEGQGEMSMMSRTFRAPLSPACLGAAMALMSSSHPTDEEEGDSPYVWSCHSRRRMPSQSCS